MKVVGVRRVEDCFEGSNVFEYEFDRPWDHAKITMLRSAGELDYFTDFPRPFFRLRGRGLQVKGVGGESTCLAIFTADGESKQVFERLFQ